MALTQVVGEVGLEIPVLNHGFVRLDGVMATDLSVVNSARVSFAVRHEGMEEGDDKLIGFLMKGRHGTPFEHNAFRFHIKAPIFVFREWQRHRISSYNELSARYKEFTDPDFYYPSEEDMRTQVGKPGAYKMEPWVGPYDRVRQLVFSHYMDSFDLYQYQIRHGVAKEIARNVLPVALYSEMYWTTNARSMMNFISLRNNPAAQLEIQRYAAVIEELFAEYMPITHKTFVENERVAP